MKVPISVDDGFYYDTENIPSLQEQRRKRDQYWRMLYQARQEYLKLTDQEAAEFNINSSAFFYYLKQHYGLLVETVDDKITGEYAVIDEKKYLVFLLKYSQ